MAITFNILKTIPGIGHAFIVSSTACVLDIESESIIYGFARTPFGCEGLFAWTAAGVLAIDFVMGTREEAFAYFQKRHTDKGISFVRDDAAAQEFAKFIFDKGNAGILWGDGSPRIPFDLRGTSLQKAVWFALAQIPFGTTISYSELASRAGYPRAIRAVATAVGQNPINYLLPCHRVVHRSIAGRPITQVNTSHEHYGFGREMKIRILKWEHENS